MKNMKKASLLVATVAALALTPATAMGAEPEVAACPPGEEGVTITYSDPYGILQVNVPVCFKRPPPTT
jgi:ABC-type sugar transport system substrate-binding protein